MKRWSIVLVPLGVVVLLLGGAYLYWRADGSVGTPEEFRDRVAEAGLDVEWTNAGPRGGDGIVETDCGPAEVTVSDFDGELWIIATDRRQPLTPSSIAALVSCTDP